ncbi:Fc.00g064570.m01.CDS01 [Cosmosporella sp. VM-42]
MASLEEKKTFYNQLKPTYSDDEFDASEEQERQRCRGFFKRKPSPKQPVREHEQNAATNPTTKAIQHQQRATPRRVVSAPIQGQRSASTQVIKGTPMAVLAQKSRLGALMNTNSPEVIIADDTPIPETARPISRGIQRSNTTPLLPSKRLLGMLGDSPSPSVALKKRKREPAVKLRTEEEQIFKGLAFYYVPDNDIAPLRRIRIGKAREYGATWTRTAFNATHIVVEKNLDFKDIKSVLERINKVSPPKLVNEDYPIDCIQFKALLRHNQKKYQLTGQPMVEEVETSVAVPTNSGESSVRSLQLKPPPNNPKRWDYVPSADTPIQSEESSQRSRIAGTPTLLDSQPVILDLDLVDPSSEEVSGDDGGVAADEADDGGLANEIPGTDQSAIISGTDGFGECGKRGEGSRQHGGQKDELSEYITMMQEYKDLPLDEEDDDARSVVDLTGVSSDVNDGSGSEDERVQRKKAAKKKSRWSKDLAFEDRFACNSAEGKNARAGNPNSRTIEVLQHMANYYDRVNDHWRTTAYRKAISTLKRQNTKVTTEEEAFRLPNIGQRLAQKIEEIVTTNRLQRLEYAQDEPMSDSLQLFLGIYGVGNSQAQQWISQGFRTLEDLKEKAKLTPNQLVGVEHYDDLNTRIPRREVEALGAVVQKAGEKIDPEVELIIGGSYRRGARTSGDIDFIITKPNTESSSELRPFIDGLVQRLEKEGFLVARLASSRSANDGSKWHGCCILPKIKGFNEENYRPVWRRIDFLLVPEAEMGAALIYFTGNDIFNRSIRLLASKKGMRLNQRGLYKDAMRGPARAKVTEGELVEGRDERRIFEILGVKWREPTERWC